MYYLLNILNDNFKFLIIIKCYHLYAYISNYLLSLIANIDYIDSENDYFLYSYVFIMELKYLIGFFVITW